MTEVNPATATTMLIQAPKQPLIDRPIEKAVVKILPKEGVQQTTVYTYNKWGQLESTVVHSETINLLI